MADNLNEEVSRDVAGEPLTSNYFGNAEILLEINSRVWFASTRSTFYLLEQKWLKESEDTSAAAHKKEEKKHTAAVR